MCIFDQKYTFHKCIFDKCIFKSIFIRKEGKDKLRTIRAGGGNFQGENKVFDPREPIKGAKLAIPSRCSLSLKTNLNTFGLEFNCI